MVYAMFMPLATTCKYSNPADEEALRSKFLFTHHLYQHFTWSGAEMLQQQLQLIVTFQYVTPASCEKSVQKAAMSETPPSVFGGLVSERQPQTLF